jgi:hypothetical protein
MNGVEIEGREFDWFAVDQDGYFALFATAGCGPLPHSVSIAVDTHDAIGDLLEVAHWGSEAVWQSYADSGLFAYDWSDTRCCYVRVAEPTAPLPAKLEETLMGCHALPRLDVSFFQSPEIQPVSHP